MDWNIYYRDVQGRKCCFNTKTENRELAFQAFEGSGIMRQAGKLTIRENKPATPKQKLGQRYGFIMGGVKGAKTQMDQAILIMKTTAPMNSILDQKLPRAISLIDAQFAKLERDIRDCFKLAGLKVK